MDITDKSIQDRFWAKVNKDGECWLWEGGKAKTGYGLFHAIRTPDGLFRAHRYSFLIAKGEIPKGLFVLHKCDVRLCVNPAHLWLGTHEDNMSDMVAKGRHYLHGKTHCSNNHELTAENLIFRTGRNGKSYNVCKACSRARRVERYYKEHPEADAKGRPGRMKKTHCLFGHEFTAENTWLRERANGSISQVCKTCARLRCVKQYHKNKLAGNK